MTAAETTTSTNIEPDADSGYDWLERVIEHYDTEGRGLESTDGRVRIVKESSEDKTVFYIPEVDSYLTVAQTDRLPGHTTHSGDKALSAYEVGSLRAYLNAAGRRDEAAKIVDLRYGDNYGFMSPNLGVPITDYIANHDVSADEMMAAFNASLAVSQGLTECPHTDYTLENLLVRNTEEGLVITPIDNSWGGVRDWSEDPPPIDLDATRAAFDRNVEGVPIPNSTTGERTVGERSRLQDLLVELR